MIFKNIFDYIIALILLILLVGLIVFIFIISSIDTKSSGIFKQLRIGKNGKSFYIYKFRTMKKFTGSNITLDTHPITKFGLFLRKYKLDELPQLFNILKGEMSFVGPRPDVKGYADFLEGEDRIILKFKPGITGPAQLKYRDEMKLLSKVEDPISYNDEIIWPDKVQINKEYVLNWKFSKDLFYIYKTIIK